MAGAARFDEVIVGGGHNGLVAAALLARAGHSVLVLERGDELGGAAASATPFAGVPARISRYAYLVSLFPRSLLRALDVRVELRRRRFASYPAADLLAPIAEHLFPTLTEPLRSREEMRRLIDDEAVWTGLFEEPLSQLLEQTFDSDRVRGVVLTDALIGTFAPADDPLLRQNRCFLYHAPGRWDVPVGGVGALSNALGRAAIGAGAEVRTRCEVLSVRTDGAMAEVECADGRRYVADHVLANVAPAALAALLHAAAPPDLPEGSQLKLNMVVRGLPRLRARSVSPEYAFSGTLHVNEDYEQLQRAFEQAASGRIPELPPCELYCHSLTDPSILGEELRAAGAHTLSAFVLHMPARLFADGHDAVKAQAVRAAFRSIDSVLAEPLEECLWLDADGAPCLEAITPVELEAELGMPGGHIFHRDLSWPFAERPEEVGSWGVETEHANVWLCGAGARRGGCVSGIPGHNAARAVLERC